MLRFFLLAFVLGTVPIAAAQNSPNNPNNPNNPNTSPNEDPNTSTAAAPPAFAPSPADPDASTAASGRVMRVSGGVMQGLLLTSVPPVYPPDARAQHLAGTVVLSARIGKDGLVRNLQPISGPQVLCHAAIAAVQQWTYTPYVLNGKPVEVNTVITVNFTPNGSPQS